MPQKMGDSTDHDAVSTPNMFLDYAVGNLTAHVASDVSAWLLGYITLNDRGKLSTFAYLGTIILLCMHIFACMANFIPLVVLKSVCNIRLKTMTRS